MRSQPGNVYFLKSNSKLSMPIPSQIIALANSAKKQIPAYQKFLRHNGWREVKITQQNFGRLPIMEKQNYIKAYGLKEFFGKQPLPQNAYCSSGSTGEPTFWYRNKGQELLGAKLHATIFQSCFSLNPKQPTLIIVAFSMGVWVAGGFTAACARLLQEQGWNITVTTPSIDITDTLHILKNLAPEYGQVVLAGYPSLVADIIHEALRQKITLPLKLRVLTAGDSFNEDWRESLCAAIPNGKPEHVLSLYGSADAGPIAYETPMSITFRKFVLGHPSLTDLLVPGTHSKQPAFFSYDPRTVYIEKHGEELLLSAPAGIPLIRYNIHDKGFIYTPNQLYPVLENAGAPKALLTMVKTSTLPIVIKTGRTDVAVTYYALNVYPEHIEMALQDERIRHMLAGDYKAYSITDPGSQKEKLVFELTPTAKYNKNLMPLIEATVFERLLAANTEFRKLHDSLGPETKPVIVVQDTVPAAPSGTKMLIAHKGKKPKLIRL